MPRGGFREGAGRKKGKKDAIQRVRKTNLPEPSEKAKLEFENFNKKFYVNIKPYLSKGTRDMYEKLTNEADYESPLECMKLVLYDLMGRYKMGRVKEIESGKTWEGITKVVDSIRQLSESISKIEKESPTKVVNILNILTKTVYKNEAKQLTQKLFGDSDVLDVEYEELISKANTVDFDKIGNTAIVKEEKEKKEKDEIRTDEDSK